MPPRRSTHARLFLIFVFVSTTGIPASVLIADDWSQWRGPARDGVWTETNVNTTLPNGQMPLEWSVPIGSGYCGPTVAGGRVFVMDRQADNRKQLERVLCLDADTGDLLWEHSYEATYEIGYTAGPRASITIHEGMAYSVGAMGHFFCFDAETGEVIWKYDLNQTYQIRMPIWGIAAAPLIYDDMVIQQVGGADGACMVAFDRKTGVERWRALDEVAGYSSPIIIQQAGQDAVVCWTGESLAALDPRTGQVHWRHPMPASRMPIGIATPTVEQERIFVSSFYDGSLMVSAPKDRLSSEVIWRKVGPSERQTESLHSMISTPLQSGDFVYGFDSYGEFRCLEAATGDRVWETQSLVPKSRWAMAHMVQHQPTGRIWMLNERGELLITEINDSGIEILARSQLIEPTRAQLNQRGGVCWSHPAFANNCIYARNDERIVKAKLSE